MILPVPLLLAFPLSLLVTLADGHRTVKIIRKTERQLEPLLELDCGSQTRLRENPTNSSSLSLSQCLPLTLRSCHSRRDDERDDASESTTQAVPGSCPVPALPMTVDISVSWLWGLWMMKSNRIDSIHRDGRLEVLFF